MAITDYAALAQRVHDYQSSLGDGKDLRSDNERERYAAAMRQTAHLLTMLRNVPTDLQRANLRLDALIAQREAVVAKERDLRAALAAAPDDRHLRRQLERLRDGLLLAAADATYPRLPDVEAAIEELTQRRDRAARALDSCVQQAEGLLASARQPV